MQVKVSLPPPGAQDAPKCPPNDCCGDTAPGEGEEEQACLLRGAQRGVCTGEAADYNDCCKPGLALCGDPVAGFNAEVVGGGGFQAVDGTKLRKEGGEDVPAQITHSTPKTLGDVGAEWTFDYTAPDVGEATQPLAFYVAANIGNGNGAEDPLDLNSQFQLKDVALDGEGDQTDIYPGYCLVCSDGKLAQGGTCCACVSATPGRGTWVFAAALGLLGFLISGRRRRRRSLDGLRGEVRDALVLRSEPASLGEPSPRARALFGFRARRRALGRHRQPRQRDVQPLPQPAATRRTRTAGPRTPRPLTPCPTAPP